MADENQQAGAQPGQGQLFNIAKIYVKDVSFETPNSPQIFQGSDWNPQVGVELLTNAKAIGDKTFEVVLTVTATAKLGEKTAYLCEVHQAGIFQLDGFDPETLKGILGSFCPSILFPYAREAVSDFVGKGGFPQLLLGPVNFDALYAQRLAQEKQKQPQTQSDATH
jgi:preprotein translocase subunit SecB